MKKPDILDEPTWIMKFRKPGVLFLIALTLAVLITHQNQIAYSFFQSPGGVDISPIPEQPTNTPAPPAPLPPPTDTPVPVQPVDTPTSAPVDTPTPEPTATQSDSGESGGAVTPAEPTPSPPAEPAAQSLPEPGDRPVAPVVQPVPATPLVQLPPAEAASAPGGPGVVLNEVKLIDTVTQWFAYIWMCVGVAVILTVPIFFLFLQLRGKQLNR